MNNTDSELRILELKKELLEVELQKLRLEKQIGESNPTTDIDITDVSNKVQSIKEESEIKHEDSTPKTNSPAKVTRNRSEAPSYDGCLSLQECTAYLGIAKGSTNLVNKIAKAFNIPSTIRHGRKYLKVTKRQFGEHYKSYMVKIGKPPRVKRLPPNHYSLKEICSWLNVKPSHAPVGRLLGGDCSKLKRVSYKGETYFYIEDKQKVLDEYYKGIEEKERQISTTAYLNFHRGIKEIQGNRLTFTDIMSIIRKEEGRCSRNYVEKFVNWMDLGDKIDPHYHPNTDKLKLNFYDITESFVVQRHKEYIHHLYGDMFDNPTDASQSEIEFEGKNNESIFSDDYPWSVHGNPMDLKLDKNSLDNIDDLDYDCIITFTKDNQPLSVKVSSLSKSCQQAVLNYVNHQ
jgi:hypothetical protein